MHCEILLKEEVCVQNVYIGKGNNDKLIKEYFKKMPLKYRILDITNIFSTNYAFKWVQCPTDIDYFSFKEGK